MTKVRKRWAIALGRAPLLLLTGYFALTTAVDHLRNDGSLARAIGKKSFLAPLFRPGKAVLGLRNALYE